MQEQRKNPEHAVNRISASDSEDRARDAGGRQIVEGNLSRDDRHVGPEVAAISEQSCVLTFFVASAPTRRAVTSPRRLAGHHRGRGGRGRSIPQGNRIFPPVLRG